MNLLYKALTDLGFTCTKPGGTFYIFPKALEEDANAFCMKAKKYDLILVPADSFGCPGYFRMAYCIDTDKVKRSIPAFKKFVREEYGVERQETEIHPKYSKKSDELDILVNYKSKSPKSHSKRQHIWR